VVIRQHIEIVQGAGGLKARIAGHRIRVLDVVIWHEKLGMSPAEILDQYPTLSLADIYAALAYYWDNRPEIESAILREQATVSRFKQGYVGPLQEQLDRSRRG
jgi:uncharacterized protein (DUF433 family)